MWESVAVAAFLVFILVMRQVFTVQSNLHTGPRLVQDDSHRYRERASALRHAESLVAQAREEIEGLDLEMSDLKKPSHEWQRLARLREDAADRLFKAGEMVRVLTEEEQVQITSVRLHRPSA